MKLLTQHEAQLYLAEKLPERIIFHEHSWKPEWTKYYWKDQCTGQTQIGTMDEVRETEWQHIALLVEEKMTDEQWSNYEIQMVKLWSAIDKSLHWITYGRFLATANYITRATAMKESGL